MKASEALNLCLPKAPSGGRVRPPSMSMATLLSKSSASLFLLNPNIQGALSVSCSVQRSRKPRARRPWHSGVLTIHAKPYPSELPKGSSVRTVPFGWCDGVSTCSPWVQTHWVDRGRNPCVSMSSRPATTSAIPIHHDTSPYLCLTVLRRDTTGFFAHIRCGFTKHLRYLLPFQRQRSFSRP